MQNLITVSSQKGFADLLSKNCKMNPRPAEPSQTGRPTRPKSERSTSARFNPGASRHLLSQFTQDLLQASTKARNLKSAIVKSVCYGLPEQNMVQNRTNQAAKGMPQISVTASDRRTNQMLKREVDTIVQLARNSRKKEVGFTSQVRWAT